MEVEWSQQVGTPTSPKVLEQRLSIRISALEQTRAEKPCRTPKDSSTASALKLRGGLPTGWVALRPLEPRHSPDKATPSHYTNNGSLASGISDMWCVFWFPPVGGGVFIGPWGSSTNLAKAVTCQVATGQPSHMPGRPGGEASTDFLHRLGHPLLV
jgi:hypothetical protein